MLWFLSEHGEMVEDITGTPWRRRKEIKLKSLKYSQMSSQSGSKIEHSNLYQKCNFNPQGNRNMYRKVLLGNQKKDSPIWSSQFLSTNNQKKCSCCVIFIIFYTLGFSHKVQTLGNES